MDELTAHIAGTLARLRSEGRMSLDEMARLTGVSRSMLRQIERGESSPTIATLWKIANGLKVSFTSLIGEGRPAVSVMDNRRKGPLTEGPAGYRLYPLYPLEQDRKFEVYFVEIDPGGSLSADGHQGGVEEYIFVSAGTLSLGVGDASYTVKRDQSVRFNASVAHRYANNHAPAVKALMVIYYP
jgi:transcriptional regulator with XRE-family HTH domain